MVAELSESLALFSYRLEIINRLNRKVAINLHMVCRSEKSRRWGASLVGG